MSSRLDEDVVSDESALATGAARLGFTLTKRELDTGQVVWTWVRPDGSGPQFLTRRAALEHMAQVLERGEPTNPEH